LRRLYKCIFSFSEIALRIDQEMIRLHSIEKSYLGKILRNVFRQSKESTICRNIDRKRSKRINLRPK